MLTMRLLWKDWIGLSSALHPRQHSIGYMMGNSFHRSKDPTNSIKVLKVHIVHNKSNVQIRNSGSFVQQSAKLISKQLLQK